MNKFSFSQLAYITMGQSPKGEYCGINIKGVPLLNGPAEFTEFAPVPVQYTSDPKKMSKVGDILFCVRGSTTGRMNWSNQEYAIGRGLAAITHKEGEQYNHFLKYLIENYLSSLLNNTNGSTFPNLTSSLLADFIVDVPDLPIQKKISNLLANIDKKIELNNQINAELEAMAKTLYDYWFVQFDFSDVEGKPYKSSGGKMVYNEVLKREIPYGWQAKVLADIANITMGQSPSGTSYNSQGMGTIFFQGSTDFGWLFPTTRQYTTEPNRMAKKGDILLSVRAPVGTMNIAKDDCCIGRGLAALNSKTGSDGFLFYVMQYYKQIFDYRNSEGTTFGSITKDDLHSLPLAYPTSDLLDKYDEIVSQSNKLVFEKGMENIQLEELKEWLLPMLMNGQVTVN